MNNLAILIILAVLVFVVTIAFIIMSVNRLRGSIDRSIANNNAQATNTDMAITDVRSRKIKCQYCGAAAYGVLGAVDVYRCQTCGYRTKKDQPGSADDNIVDMASRNRRSAAQRIVND